MVRGAFEDIADAATRQQKERDDGCKGGQKYGGFSQCTTVIEAKLRNHGECVSSKGITVE